MSLRVSTILRRGLNVTRLTILCTNNLEIHINLLKCHTRLLHPVDYIRGAKGDPPNFWNKKKCVSTGQSRFASVVCEGVLGPPHLVWHNWWCHLSPLGRGASLKARRGSEKRRANCWEELKRTVFPRWGVIDLTCRQINDFLQRKKLS